MNGSFNRFTKLAFFAPHRPLPLYNVARGEADMVVVVASRIVGVPGVEFVSLIPAEVQTNIGFATGVSCASKEPEVAHALVRYLTAPAAEQVLRKAGIEPFVE